MPNDSLMCGYHSISHSGFGALAGGPKYSIPTGRRDGLVSNPADVNLPGPSLTVQEALKFFTNKKFSLNDMVTLLGAHTVGNTHCICFKIGYPGNTEVVEGRLGEIRKN